MSIADINKTCQQSRETRFASMRGDGGLFLTPPTHNQLPAYPVTMWQFKNQEWIKNGYYEYSLPQFTLVCKREGLNQDTCETLHLHHVSTSSNPLFSLFGPCSLLEHKQKEQALPRAAPSTENVILTPLWHGSKSTCTFCVWSSGWKKWGLML